MSLRMSMDIKRWREGNNGGNTPAAHAVLIRHGCYSICNTHTHTQIRPPSESEYAPVLSSYTGILVSNHEILMGFDSSNIEK